MAEEDPEERTDFKIRSNAVLKIIYFFAMANPLNKPTTAAIAIDFQ